MTRITKDEAIALNQNFVTTRGNIINKTLKKKDAISSWFSVEELEKFITDAKLEAKQQKKEVSGFRVYFGAYGVQEKDKEKDNMSTIFIVPTQEVIKNSETENEPVDAVVHNADITDIDGLNDGGLGDPPYGIFPQ
ncbi:hypothetical protein SAMN05444411_10143 [Lutibacter oricola]|uniref:Uncharacterized protein n=1 Tax=Lutibacter oricola TaxID=762486 RepID=A0A1H2QQ04_9FLAO|nr:hypothetical protein [Lutibacter oricola]SDW08539.1 hypothetical protein SAMN05444411_10143 [Lutibacter oricola]